MKAFISYLLAFSTCLISCRKFLDVGQPSDRVSSDFVYQYDASAAAVLTGIYYDLQKDNGIAQGVGAISLMTSLASDEISSIPISLYYGYYSNGEYPDFWTPLYSFIYRLNTSIEGVSNSSTLSNEVKSQLLGEAKFMRAFFYYYLVNMYGSVPLLTSPDYKLNSVAARSPINEVYNQIIDDLIEAKENLKEEYVSANATTTTTERVRPNKWVASALLARVYLFLGRWAEAENETNALINHKGMFELVSLNEVFLKNSKETIWQLQPLSDDGLYRNSLDAKNFILLDGEPNFNRPFLVSDQLLSAFEFGDRRLNEWIKVDSSKGTSYYYPYKYKIYEMDQPAIEYPTVFRLSEQYLIRAESRIRQSKIFDGIADINSIRTRAGLPSLMNADQEQLLDTILHERRVELFTEWGHRWFDLKRTNRIDQVMDIVSPLKEGVWQPFKQWFPIPVSDLLYNKNLKQNEGYPSS